MKNSEEIWRHVDAKKQSFIALSDRIWGMPELCYTEKRSCAEHVAALEAEGFRVTRDVAGIPTAVIGEAFGLERRHMLGARAFLRVAELGHAPDPVAQRDEALLLGIDVPQISSLFFMIEALPSHLCEA